MAPYSRYEDDPSLLPLTSFDDSPTSTLNRLIAHSPSASPIPPRLVEMYDEPVDEDIGVVSVFFSVFINIGSGAIIIPDNEQMYV